MRNFWIILSVFWLWTCSSGGDKATGPEEPPIVINLTSLNGQAQKGPFNNGTAINIAELTNTLSPTGRNFSTAITDNTGRFAVANVQLESPYVELRANGYYFNEVSNEISSGQLTLFALSNLTGKTSLNVNIITHLEKNRMVTLMSGDNPKTFAQAKLQAQEELFAVFDYSRADVPESELLDISQGGAANGKLLAMSAIIQGDLTVGQMSQLLANISTDIASDGTLDDNNLRNTLIENSKNLDIAEIRSHLEAHYSSLGISATIPDFETEIDQFLKPPVSEDINASTAEDTPINITLAGSDPEGESLTYTILEVNNATVTLNGNVANYTPNVNFNGTDTFTYYANDGTSDSNISTVTMNVSAEDDEPNTIDVATATDEDVAVTVNLSADEYDGDSYSFAIITDVSNGTTALNGSTVTYTPNQDWNGTDTFTFEATDDRTARTNVATATITVNPVNDTPTISAGTISTDEDIVATLDLNTLSIDVDGDNLTFDNTPPGDGSVTIDGSILTYTPKANWFGTEPFMVTANDGSVTSTQAQIVVTVASVNDAPIANDITISTNETRFISVDINLDATDVDGDNLTYTIVSDASNATTTLNGGIVTYVPTTDWNGEDSFTFKANDGTVDSNTATATITVNAINDAPSIEPISVSTNEDNAIEITLLGTDVDGDEISYEVTPDDGPSNGSVGIIDGSKIIYTPNENWNGTDSFKYSAYDGSLYSDSLQVSITVNAINDIPVVYDASISGDEDATSSVGGSSINGFKFILPEATDVESGSSDDFHNSLEIVTLPTHGKIYSNNNEGDDSPENELSVGSAMNNIDDGYGARIWYVQDTEHWNGTDTFTYKANDGTDDSNISTVTITVNSVNDAPTATDISVNSNEDEVVTYDLSSIVSDVEGDQLTYTVSSQPGDGTTAISGSVLTYTPNADYNGSDTSNWSVSDGIVTITKGFTAIVAAVNDAPIAYGFNQTTDEDNAKIISLKQTSPGSNTGTNNEGGVYDPDVETGQDTPITFSLISQPSNGTATLASGDNDITYTPDANWNGTDTFTYKGNDGTADSNTATITISVNPVNDKPTAVDVSKTMDENGGTIDVETYYNDVDGDTDITFTLVDAPANGTATVGIPGTYTPNSNFNGTDTFTYTVSDAEYTSDPATVTITVIPGSFGITYGIDSNHETPSSITATSDGGAVVVGYRYYTDWLVVKFDNAGNSEWEYTIPSSEGPSQVIETLDGGIIIAGNSDNGETIIKLDSSGNEVFSSSNLPGSGILLLKEDSSGNIYASGFQSVDGTRSGSLTKLDSNGNLLWNKTYRKYSSNNEYVEAFVIHPDQSITAVGFGQNASNNEWIFNVDSSGNASNMSFIDLDGGYPKNAELLSNGNIKIIVDTDQIVEVSTDFSIIDSINLSFPNAGGTIGILKSTSDGGFIGAGRLNDSSTSLVDDGFFIKYDSSGTAEITKNVSTSLRDWFNSVDIISSGGYYFAGWSKGDDGDWDIYLVKVDDQGNRIF